MRNLKRALSLTLASVMLLGMMVIGTSAAGYPDVTEEDNIEAIEVLQAVQVMRGDDNGNFDPDRSVTRAEMAVIMALLLDLDYEYYEATCPFTDVPSWARPYVGACYANKIVSGYNATTYGANDTVTAVQAASMLMRALGYFKFSSDYKDGFETATVRQGSKIGIFKGVDSKVDAAMTRNQVAQMALNALKTPIVEPEDNTINITDGNGNLVATGGQVNYVVTASSQPFARAIGKDEVQGTGLNKVNGYIIELGEKLYDGSLKLNDYYTDDFGRPSRNWEYNNKEIGTYAKKELMVKDYVGGVTGKDLYDLLSKSTIDRYDLLVTIDGVSDKTLVGADGKNKSGYLVFDKIDMNKDNKEKVGGTGTGTLTQVYVDDGNTVLGVRPQIYITIINTYLAKAERDYDEKKDELALTVYGVKKNATTSNNFVKCVVKDQDDSVAGVKVAAEEIPGIESVKKDDFSLVTVAGGEIMSLAAPEILSGVQISAFKVGSNVTVDGVKHDFTTTAEYKHGDLSRYTGSSNSNAINLKDLTYNVYLDAYGNLIGVEEVESVKNYVFITGVDPNGSNIINKTADARGLFLDGTSDIISFKTDKGDGATLRGTGTKDRTLTNTWCTYTVDKNGVYTLTKVPDTTNNNANVPNDTNKYKLAQYHQAFGVDTTINSKNSTLRGRNFVTAGNLYNTVYGDKETVYLTAKLDRLGNYGIIKDVDSVIVGAEKTDLKVWSTATANTKYKTAPGYADAPTNTQPNFAYGAYTLYDDGAAIIATVIVGEDNGASKNIVYVHSGDLEREEYNYGSSDARSAAEGEWTWTRKVIKDGEEIELVEIGDDSSYLENMEQYKPYQIKLNANGEVIGAYRLPGITYSHTRLPESDMKGAEAEWTTADEFKDVEVVTDYKQLGLARENGKDTLVFASKTLDNKLKMNNTSALYVVSNYDSGFLVNDNTRVVLIEYVKNTKETYIADEGNGGAKVKSIVDGINAKYRDLTSYKYEVTAVMNKGVATSVIIWDRYNDYLDGWTGSNTGKPTDGVSMGNVVYKDEITSTTALRRLYERYDTNVLVVDNEYDDFTAAITVPDGKTLAFTGNVSNVKLGRNSTLLVDGTYTTSDSIPSTATVRAGNIVTNATLTFSGTVTADQDLTVASGKTLTIASGSTTNVGRAIKKGTGSNDGWIYVRGTLYVNKNQLVNDDYAVKTGVGIIVASVNSLHILGGTKAKVQAGATIIQGNGTNNGRVVAPSVKIEGTFIDLNKKAANSSEVSTIGALTGTVVLNKNTEIEGLVEFAPNKLSAPKGATISFDSEAKADESITFNDAGGNVITSIAGKTVTFGATVGDDVNGKVPSAAITVNTNTGDVKVESTTIAPTADPKGVTEDTTSTTTSSTPTVPTTPTTVPTETVEDNTSALAMGKAWIVYDEATWTAAYKALGGCAVLGLKWNGTQEVEGTYATQWSELSPNGKTQLPWLIVEVTNPDKKAIDLKFTVEKDGETTALFTDGSAQAYSADKTHYLRSWTMWNESAQHADKLSQSKADMEGTYSISAKWALTGQEVYAELDPVTISFDEADREAYEVAKGNNVMVKSAAGVTYGKLADLAAAGGNITLIDDVDVNNSPIALATNTTLNLNGHTISGATSKSASKVITLGTSSTAVTNVVIKGEGSIVGKMDGGSFAPIQAIGVYGGSELRMENVTVSGNGAMGIYASGTSNPAKVVLDNCDLSCDYEDVKSNGSKDGFSVISTSGNNKTRTDEITIIGGTVKGKLGGMYLPGKAVVKITDGALIEGRNGIGMKSSELTIENSTVRGTWNNADDTTAKTDGINTNGSAIVIEDNGAYVGGMKVILRGATLESKYAYAIYEVAADGHNDRFVLDKDESSTLTPGEGLAKMKVSLGTYEWSPLGLIDADEFAVNTTEDGKYTVANAS